MRSGKERIKGLIYTEHTDLHLEFTSSFLTGCKTGFPHIPSAASAAIGKGRPMHGPRVKPLLSHGFLSVFFLHTFLSLQRHF